MKFSFFNKLHVSALTLYENKPFKKSDSDTSRNASIFKTGSTL